MITVFIREDEGTVSVGVQDQGIGIAEINVSLSLYALRTCGQEYFQSGKLRHRSFFGEGTGRDAQGYDFR